LAVSGNPKSGSGSVQAGGIDAETLLGNQPERLRQDALGTALPVVSSHPTPWAALCVEQGKNDNAMVFEQEKDLVGKTTD